MSSGQFHEVKRWSSAALAGCPLKRLTATMFILEAGGLAGGVADIAAPFTVFVVANVWLLRGYPRPCRSTVEMNDDHTSSGCHTARMRSNARSSAQPCRKIRYRPKNAETRILAAQ